MAKRFVKCARCDGNFVFTIFEADQEFGWCQLEII